MGGAWSGRYGCRTQGARERSAGGKAWRGHPAHWRAGYGSRDPAQGKAGPTPFRQPEVVEMSRATSTGTGTLYGLQRVCRVLGFPRSTIYAGRARASSNVVPLVAQRRGPKPRMPDADLLETSRADLN